MATAMATPLRGRSVSIAGCPSRKATGVVWLWPVAREHVGYSKVALSTAESLTEMGVPSCVVDHRGRGEYQKRISGPFVLVEYARKRATDKNVLEFASRASARCAWLCADGSPVHPAAAAGARDALVTFSPSSASSDACRRAGLHPVITLPVGVRVADWSSRSTPPAGPVRFVWRGSDPYRKGLDIFLDAFLRVPGQVRATVVLPSAEAVHEERRKRPEDDRIEWVGGYKSQSELARILSRCHIAVAPSRSEGANLCALEAMAAGLPLIYTAGTGMDDFAGGAGIPVDAVSRSPSHIDLGDWLEPDPHAVAAAMRGLAHHAETRRGVAEECMKRATRETWAAAARVLVSSLVSRGVLCAPKA